MIDPSKLICIGCPNGCELDVRNENGEIISHEESKIFDKDYIIYLLTKK